jgi:anti-sigma regulatory factor (Ser/Thr protein kinase)
MDIGGDATHDGPGMSGFGDHLVQFHDSDHDLVAAVVEFVAAGLVRGEGGVVVATAGHQVAIVRALRASGVDPSPIVTLDARDCLDRIVAAGGGAIDATRFDELVDGALQKAASRSSVPRVRVFGEMVALLWDRGQVSLAAELEGHWNRAARGPIPFTLLCGYRMPDVTEDRAAAERFFDACGHHSAVRRSLAAPTEAWRRFDRAVRELPGARAFVRGTLGAWGCHGVVTEAALVVTELATNAVIHARTAFHVSVLRHGDGAVRVSVHDACSDVPAPQPSPAASAAGRGLHLVRSLSAAWGIEHFAGHKSVWAELRPAAG